MTSVAAHAPLRDKTDKPNSEQFVTPRTSIAKGVLVSDGIKPPLHQKRRASNVSTGSIDGIGTAWRRRSSIATSTGGGAGAGRRTSRVMTQKGMPSLSKITQSQQSNHRPQIKYENTYKMKPDKETKFDTTKVKRLMKSMMELMLADTRYNPVSAKVASNQLAEKIRQSVKDMGYARYKIICHVIIGEVKHQGVQHVSRCVWDTTTDNYVSETYHNSSLFATSSVYGIYFE